MSKAILVLKECAMVPQEEADYVGVEEGLLYLLENGFIVKYAIGDFDSISLPKELDSNTNVIRLSSIKNDSDSEHAIRFLIQEGYQQIDVYGALGNRIDHEYVNLELVKEFPNQVRLIDSTNLIQAYSVGSYDIQKNGFQYFSIFPIEDSIISLVGFMYPLEKQKMKPKDLYGLSNEFLGETASMHIHQGKVLVIQSNDKKRSQ